MRTLLLAVAMLLAASVAAVTFAQSATPGRRVAVVVGVGAYQSVPTLANPPRDARAVAAALQKLGFDTTLVIDPDRAALEQAVRTLGDKARNADAAVFFYAGHALEADGRNYIIPVSAKIATLRDLPFETVDLDLVGQQAEGRARTVIVFMDACRDNPFAARLAASGRGIRPGGGLAAPASDSSGTLIAFATAPGHTAEDGSGADSPFTTALLAHVATPGLEVRQMLGLVRHDVREATDGKQVPWESSALEGEFYFAPTSQSAPAHDAASATAPARGAANAAQTAEAPVPPASPPASAAASPPARGAAAPPPIAQVAPVAAPPGMPSPAMTAPPAPRYPPRPLAGDPSPATRPNLPQYPLIAGLASRRAELGSRCHVNRVEGIRRLGGTETVMHVASDGRGCAFRVFLRQADAIPFDSLVPSTRPAYGTVRVNENSQVVYTPRPGFVGEDVFVVTSVPAGRLLVRVVVRPPQPG